MALPKGDNMKTRSGFVSNSSSSSFVIQKSTLTPIQIHLIKEHLEVSRKIDAALPNANGQRRIGGYRMDENGEEGEWDENLILGRYDISEGDAWTITETDSIIEGSTFMNNFDMNIFLREIGVSDPPSCSED